MSLVEKRIEKRSYNSSAGFRTNRCVRSVWKVSYWKFEVRVYKKRSLKSEIEVESGSDETLFSKNSNAEISWLPTKEVSCLCFQASINTGFLSVSVDTSRASTPSPVFLCTRPFPHSENQTREGENLITKCMNLVKNDDDGGVCICFNRFVTTGTERGVKEVFFVV